MTNISAYDSTANLLEELSKRYDVPVAEILDIFLPDEDYMEEALEEQGFSSQA